MNITKAPLTMSSLEIARMTGRKHSNVCRDIREILKEEDGIEYEKDYRGYVSKYIVPQRLAILMLCMNSKDHAEKFVDLIIENFDEDVVNEILNTKPKKKKSLGAIYVLNLGNKLVKVGKSINPMERIKTHKRSFGRTIGIYNQWISPIHENFHENERALIEFLSEDGKEIEYANFEKVLEFAKGLEFNT